MAWNPNDVGTIQWALDTEYGANYTALDGVPVLNSLETHGDDRAPRGQRCYAPDGVDDVIDFGPDIEFSDGVNDFPFSVFMRVYLDSIGDGLGGLASKAEASPDNEWIFSINSTGTLLLRLYDRFTTNAITYDSTATVAAGTWLTIASTYDGSAQATGVNVYVNGTPFAGTVEKIGTYQRMVPGSAPLRVARSFGRYLSGKVSQCILYEKALTQSEIAYLNGDPGTDPGNNDTVFSLWCNEESGLTCYDSSGSGNHGTIQNANLSSFHAVDSGVLVNPANSLGHTNNAGVIVPRNEAIPAQDVLGGALQFSGKAPNPIQIESPCATFDGTDDYVDCGDIFNFTKDDPFTLSAWIKAVSVGSAQVLFAKQSQSSPQRGYRLSFDNPANHVDFILANASTSNRLAGSVAVTIGDNNWHHIVSTYDGSSDIAGLNIYVDGVWLAVETTANNLTQDTVSPETFRLGARATNLFLNGSMMKPQVWTKELTADEVTWVYNQGTSGTDPGNASGQWPMQEGSGATVFDVSGAGNHGTVTNASLAAFWANRSNSVQDHSINYGGRWDVLVFVPGLLDGSAAADGNPLDFSGDHLPNQGSRIIFDPYGAPELSPLNFPALSTVGEDLRIVAPNETKFRSLRNDAAAADPLGDRYLTAVPSTLSGADLQNMLDYLSGNLPPDFVAAWAANSTRLISGSLAGA